MDVEPQVEQRRTQPREECTQWALSAAAAAAVAAVAAAVAAVAE